jgi:hypothetical protein
VLQTIERFAQTLLFMCSQLHDGRDPPASPPIATAMASSTEASARRSANGSAVLFSFSFSSASGYTGAKPLTQCLILNDVLIVRVENHEQPPHLEEQATRHQASKPGEDTEHTPVKSKLELCPVFICSPSRINSTARLSFSCSSLIVVRFSDDTKSSCSDPVPLSLSPPKPVCLLKACPRNRRQYGYMLVAQDRLSA